jgi:transposase
MADQLDMRKSLAITQLHQQGVSQRDVAQTLGVSRGAVIRIWMPTAQTVPKRKPAKC